MPTAHINGVNIYYEVTGDGSPLVFCHEFAGSYESWERQVQFFSQKYKVITYNARGYPPSDVPEDLDSYSQEIAIEDLRQLLQHLEIDRAYICGLSMGGNVALNFGIAHPSMARALVVAGTGTGSTDPDRFRKEIDKEAARLETEGMESQDAYLRSPTRVQLLRKDRKAWEECTRLFSMHSALGSALILRGVLARRPPIFDLKPKLRKLKVSTLIMVGDEDYPCIEPAIFMKRHISTSGLLVFPQTGHTLNLEEPQLFNHSVQSFFSAVEEGRWADNDADASADFLISSEAKGSGGKR
ncbi:MAG: alpha/beta fold hydrolase [Dehalococcoidia bacterium]